MTLEKINFQRTHRGYPLSPFDTDLVNDKLIQYMHIWTAHHKKILSLTVARN